MKSLVTILLFILLFFSSNIYGQLQVNAGADTIVCIGVWGEDTVELGGNPTAFGGTEPYNYAWTTKHKVGTYTYLASHILDDTTLSNPKIIGNGSSAEYLKFKLFVADSNGTQVEDSINIRFSRFLYLTVSSSSTINRGDTTTLMYSIGGGIDPLSFEWTPDYNISDPFISSPMAWPDTTIRYQLIVTDSAGCISEPDYFDVFVNPTEIISIKKTLYQSTVFPNPININSMIQFDANIKENLVIQILNVKGQIVHIDNFSSNFYMIGDKISISGIYYYLISRESELITSGQFVKN